MRVTLPRFTIRRLMILVALVAVLLGVVAAWRAEASRFRMERAMADVMAQRAVATRRAALAPTTPTMPR